MLARHGLTGTCQQRCDAPSRPSPMGHFPENDIPS